MPDKNKSLKVLHFSYIEPGNPGSQSVFSSRGLMLMIMIARPAPPLHPGGSGDLEMIILSWI